jgi:hypothetical protein
MTNRSRRLNRSVRYLTPVLGIVGLTVISACSDAKLGGEQVGSTEQAWIDTGANASVTPNHYAWDPTVAYQPAVSAPEGRHVLGRYVSAYSLVPEATIGILRDEIGWSTSDDGGTKDPNWVAHVPTNTTRLPIARPSAQKAPSDCPGEPDPSDPHCIWGVYSQPPVVVAGPEPGSFAIVAGIASQASTFANDIAFAVSTDNGDTFYKQAFRVSEDITDSSADGVVSGNVGKTSGPIEYLDATTTDGGKRLWIYWQTKATHHAYMRAYDWNPTTHSYAPAADLPQPFPAPGNSTSSDVTVAIEKPKLVVDRVSHANNNLGDYRIILVGTHYRALYSEIVNYTKISGKFVDREEDLCPTAGIAIALDYVIVSGEASGNHFWKSQAVLTSTKENGPLPLCIGDGRKVIANAFGYPTPNPLARLHFRPSAVIVPPNATDSVAQFQTNLEVAYVLADPQVNGIPGGTYVEVQRLSVDWITASSGINVRTHYTLDGAAWRDPTRPPSSDVAYTARLYDQWNPTLASIPTSSGYEAMMIWQDAREGTTTTKSGGLWRYVTTRAASRNSFADWKLASEATSPAPLPGTGDDLSTAPPNSPPWAVRSPLGRNLGIVGQTRSGMFMSVWPDNRFGQGNVCNPKPMLTLESAASVAN